MHRSDTVQEKLSLAARFGVTIYYGSPDKFQFQGIVKALAEKYHLDMPEEEVRTRVEKVSSIERIRTNVDKETGDAILNYGLAGVKVDADYKRYYPYGDLASRVLGVYRER